MSQSFELTRQMRLRGLTASIGCTAAAALGLGGLLPLLSITLERMEVSGFLIGVSTAMPFLSSLLIMPFLPNLLKIIPIITLLVASILISSLAVLFYGLFIDVWLWMPVRFVNGIVLGILFATSEAWINHFAEESKRGRIIALYATVTSGFFACGPLILWLVGTNGLQPYLFCAFLILLALIPVFLARNLPEAFYHDEAVIDGQPQKFHHFFFLIPTLALAGIIYGAIETSIVGFLPIYNIRLGFSESFSIISLSAFFLGDVCCQIPIGWLADKYNRRVIFFWCATIASLAMMSIFILFLSVPALDFVTHAVFLALLFIFGASGVGIYTMAMVQIGERFQGARLANANAMLVFCYNLGSLIMPLIIGGLLDVFPRKGFPLALIILILICFVPSIVKYLKRIMLKWSY